MPFGYNNVIFFQAVTCILRRVAVLSLIVRVGDILFIHVFRITLSTIYGSILAEKWVYGNGTTMPYSEDFLTFGSYGHFACNLLLFRASVLWSKLSCACLALGYVSNNVILQKWWCEMDGFVKEWRFCHCLSSWEILFIPFLCHHQYCMPNSKKNMLFWWLFR